LAGAAARDHLAFACVSTLGFGGGYKYSFNETFGARIGYNTYSMDGDTTDRDVKYEGSLKLKTVELLADYHPWRNGFTVTAGVLYNRSKLTADGRSSNNSVTINGTTYVGSNVSARYENELDSDKWSPYVGIGWTSKPAGTPGFGFNARLGAMFQNPKGQLTTSGITDTTGTLESNRAAAEKSLNDDVNKAKVYPVVGLGLSYVF
jgi:hypothetical protein